MRKTHRALYSAMSVFLLLTFGEGAIVSVSTRHAAAYAGGDGTAGAPYQIANCDDLESMTTGDSGIHYILMQDIDCSAVNGGAGFIPIGGFDDSQFRGTLDGKNFTVSNLAIDAANNTYAGMFGFLSGATVKNLKLDHVTIDNGSYTAGTLAGGAGNTTISHVSSTNFIIHDTDGWDVGGLIGQYGSGDGGTTLNTLDSSTAQGTITASGIGGAAYGGLVGELDYDTVANSYADVTITATGVQRAGGLVGYSYYGHLDKNYASGSLDVYSDAGGLVGWAYTGGSYTNNFAATSIATQNGHTGGIAGSINAVDSGNVTNNYYDATATGQTQCDPSDVTSGCSAVNTDGTDMAHFKNNNTVAPLNGWDFTNTWQTSAEYPTLQDANLSATVADGVLSLNATPGDEELTVTWLAPLNDGGSVITDYQVRYRVHGTSTWTNTHTGSVTTSKTITALTNGALYDVAVAATNGIGTSAYTELDSVAPGREPSAPTNLQAFADYGSASILLRWDSPDDVGGSPLTDYTVSIRDVDGDNVWSTPILLSTVTFQHTFAGLTLHHHYDLRVAGVNDFGTGTYAEVDAIRLAPQVYDITTCEDLQAMNNDLSGDYRLMNNIDCSATATWNGGAGFIPIDNGAIGEGFSGSLDGRGHMIEDIYINSSDDEAGLFSALIGGASVTNLKLTGQIAGGANVGAIAAVAVSGVTIDHVSAEVEVVSNDTNGGFFLIAGAGGLVGFTGIDVVISNSSVSGIVAGIAADDTFDAVGGIVGVALDGTIVRNSFATAEVGTPSTGNLLVGGLVGMMLVYIGGDDPIIQDSYSAGAIFLNDGSVGGGLVGGIQGGEIDNSFAATTLNSESGPPSGAGAVGINTDSTLQNVYFDATVAGGADCVLSGVPDGCSPVNGDGEEPNYFFNTTTNPPLDQWDFAAIWQVQADAYPVLRALLAPPDDSGGDGGGGTGSEGDSSDGSHTSTSSGSSHNTEAFVDNLSGGALQSSPSIAPPKSHLSFWLDTMQDFTNGAGSVLSLKVGQVVHFTVWNNGEPEDHTITLTSIGKDYVIVTVASKPVIIRINEHERKTISVNGRESLYVTLQDIHNGSATLQFSKIAISAGKATPSPRRSASYPITAVVIGLTCLAIVGIGGAVIRAARRPK